MLRHDDDDDDDDDDVNVAHIAYGSCDVQSSEHVHSGLSTPPNCRTRLQPNLTFICHPAARQTVHKNRLL